MNGRAAFYAEKSPDTIHFLKEGRLFGPHGEGLIVADSIENYNEEISSYLTERTVNANKVVQSFGYKTLYCPFPFHQVPYPSLSHHQEIGSMVQPI